MSKPVVKPASPVSAADVTDLEKQPGPDPVAAPAFTTDQKLAIREAQLHCMKLREQSVKLIEQAAKAEQGIVSYINNGARALGVDNTVYSFNIDTLDFYKTSDLKPAGN